MDFKKFRRIVFYNERSKTAQIALKTSPACCLKVANLPSHYSDRGIRLPVLQNTWHGQVLCLEDKKSQ